MKIQYVVAALLLDQTFSFTPTLNSNIASRFNHRHVGVGEENEKSATALFMAVSRKARRKSQKEQGNSRPNSFYEAMGEIDESKGGKKKKKKGGNTADQEPEGGDEPSLVSGGSVSDAQVRMDERPDVSSIIVDEQTGIERIQQGKYVMDTVTRKAVQLSSLGPEYRMAQMFPGVPPEVRETHRFDWTTIEVNEMVDKLREACMVSMKDEEMFPAERPTSCPTRQTYS